MENKSEGLTVKCDADRLNWTARYGLTNCYPAEGLYRDPWVQEVIELPGLSGLPSWYGLMVLHRDPHVLAVVSELPDNPGTSVTNHIENIATALIVSHPALADVEPSRLYVVEHYTVDYRRKHRDQPHCANDFDLVAMQWHGHTGFRDPQWRSVAALLNDRTDAARARHVSDPAPSPMAASVTSFLRAARHRNPSTGW